LRLLRLALAGQTRFRLDDQEIERGGISYSVDTVRNYASRYPEAELWYVIGSDHARLLPKWRAADELAALVQFAIVPRPGQNTEPLPAPFRVRWLHGWSFDISASQIRERVHTGRAIDLFVPSAVAEGIRNNRLYL
jgi:nicotinate-nucleotide adenylyltransferase